MLREAKLAELVDQPTVEVGDAVKQVFEEIEIESAEPVEVVPEAAPPPIHPEIRKIVTDGLEDFGVDTTGMTDVQLKAAVTNAADKMLLGAEHDSDLTALPTIEALNLAATAELAGGSSKVNSDGSTTLYTADGTPLETIPAGEDGGDPRATALQTMFNLPTTSAVPTSSTMTTIFENYDDGGSAVVHVGGAVDLLDADGNVWKHIEPDIGSQVSQALETALEGLSTAGEQLKDAPQELKAEFDDAADQLAATVGNLDTVDDQIGAIPDTVAAEWADANEQLAGAAQALGTVGDQLAAIPGQLDTEMDAAATQVDAAMDNLGAIITSGIDQAKAWVDGVVADVTKALTPPTGETPPGETPPGETPPGETPPGETPPAGEGAPANETPEEKAKREEEEKKAAEKKAAEEKAAEEGTAPNTKKAEGEETPADGATTPNPEGEGAFGRAPQEFLDSPLGREQQKREQDAIDMAESGGHTDPSEEGGGRPGLVIDPRTGEATVGPIRTPGGGEPVADGFGGSVSVSRFDVENLELLSTGGGAAGPEVSEDGTAPTPPAEDPHSRSPIPATPHVGGGRGGQSDEVPGGGFGTGAVASKDTWGSDIGRAAEADADVDADTGSDNGSGTGAAPGTDIGGDFAGLNGDAPSAVDGLDSMVLDLELEVEVDELDSDVADL